MKTKLPKVSALRNKCDALLTPLIKLIFPRCLLCGKDTEVAHHHVHKSKSTRLRYEIDNLIPLCQKCHITLHHNESYWASKIVEIRGLEWFKGLERKKNEIVKADVHYFVRHHLNLSDLMRDLKSGLAKVIKTKLDK